jgi:hypothetical protein
VNRHPRYAFTYFLRHPTILHNILCQMVALDKFECPIRTGTIRVVTAQFFPAHLPFYSASVQ